MLFVDMEVVYIVLFQAVEILNSEKVQASDHHVEPGLDTNRNPHSLKLNCGLS